MSSTGGTLQVARPARARLWQILVLAAVLIAGFAMGIFAGRVTATKSEPVAKREPAIAILPSELNDRAAELRRHIMRGMNRIHRDEALVRES